MQKEKPHKYNILVNTRFLHAETVGFEPTCRLPDNLISSQARYDHFDTFPDMKLADQIIQLHFIIIKEEADYVNRFPPVFFILFTILFTYLTGNVRYD